MIDKKTIKDASAYRATVQLGANVEHQFAPLKDDEECARWELVGDEFRHVPRTSQTRILTGAELAVLVGQHDQWLKDNKLRLPSGAIDRQVVILSFEEVKE